MSCLKWIIPVQLHRIGKTPQRCQSTYFQRKARNPDILILVNFYNIDTWLEIKINTECMLLSPTRKRRKKNPLNPLVRRHEVQIPSSAPENRTKSSRWKVQRHLLLATENSHQQRLWDPTERKQTGLNGPRYPSKAKRKWSRRLCFLLCHSGS